jgi:hypothetical protein
MKAVVDDGMPISPVGTGALALAADYATGNRPQTAFARVIRAQAAAEAQSAPPGTINDDREADDGGGSPRDPAGGESDVMGDDEP